MHWATMRKTTFAALWIGLWAFVAVRAQSFDVLAEANKMIAAARSTQTLQYELYKWERVGGKLLHENNIVKWKRSPRSIYIKIMEPSVKEVLYVEGKNNNMALVNVGKFLPNLNLDPNGGLMRKDKHHTIYATGFDYTVELIEHLVNKHKHQAHQMARYLGQATVHGRACHKIELADPNFKYVPYTVGKGENLITIARKLKLSEFMILEKNPSVKSYYSVTPGQKIKIPTSFGAKTILCIDKITHLPASIEVFDDEGLFEKYEYKNVVVNPKFKDDEFSPDYKEYGF
jgi:hypothetical protein